MWYIIYNGQQVGPLQREQLSDYNLTPQSMVWTEGMPQWMPAGNVQALSDLFSAPRYAPGSEANFNTPYGQPPVNSYSSSYKAPKSKVAAGVLAIILGALGVQYFYLGKIGGGFLTILLTVVTCGAWEVITFIQGILMLCMSDQEFNYKYVYNDKTFPLF